MCVFGWLAVRNSCLYQRIMHISTEKPSHYGILERMQYIELIWSLYLKVTVLLLKGLQCLYLSGQCSSDYSKVLVMLLERGHCKSTGCFRLGRCSGWLGSLAPGCLELLNVWWSLSLSAVCAGVMGMYHMSPKPDTCPGLWPGQLVQKQTPPPPSPTPNSKHPTPVLLQK